MPREIIVSPEFDRPRATTEWSPDAIISIVSPRTEVPAEPTLPHLVLRFHDVESISRPREMHRAGRHNSHHRPSRKTAPRLVLPARESVETLIAFAAQHPGRILVHCNHGVSRAPAAALAIARASWPAPGWAGHASALAALFPDAQPNMLMIALAASILGDDPQDAIDDVVAALPTRDRLPWGARGISPGAIRWHLAEPKGPPV